MTWQTFLTAFGGGLVALLGGGAILVFIQREWLEEEREKLAEAVRQIERSQSFPIGERGDRVRSSHAPTGHAPGLPYPYHNQPRPPQADHNAVYGSSDWGPPPGYASYHD